MGLSPMKSSVGCNNPPNPNPSQFSILRTVEHGRWCLALIHYNGCTTFNGGKALVFECSEAELRARTEVDPHFLGNSDDPIARFPASVGGWRNAVRFLSALGDV